MKILILASNPRKDLNLDHEIRDLKEVIRKSRNYQSLEVEDALAVRVGDLQDLLFKYEPQIVHFCGHGGGQPGLVFEGNDGGEQWVRTDALRDLFRLFSDRVGCVLLNACYSEEQANEIVSHIGYVIGMNQEIRDDAAIAFSKGFYRALGYGCGVEEAYEFGCNAIQLEITGSSVVRSALTNSTRKAEIVNAVEATVIPEHLKPILKINQDILETEQRKRRSKSALSQGKRDELHWDLAQEIVGSPLGKSPSDKASSDVDQGLSFHNFSETPVSYHRRQAPLRLLVGSLLLCGVLTGGIFSYLHLQREQIAQSTLLQAKEFADQALWEPAISTLAKIPSNSSLQSQAQSYLIAWAPNLFEQASQAYQKGEIKAAMRIAKVIPENSPIYQDAQIAIQRWSYDQKIFDEIRAGLKEWDVEGGRRKLAEIQSPGLRQQAEISIVNIEQRVKAKITPEQIERSDPGLQYDSKKLNEPSSGKTDLRYIWLSERKLEPTDLVGKSARELSLMRNSIYARYGYVFRSLDLRSIFLTQSWYKPIYEDDSTVYNMFTKLERENVKLIEDGENQAK